MMMTRTIWRVREEPCAPGEARGLWEAARDRGATGAVTSWGSGIQGRRTLRTFWEALPGSQLPEGEDLAEEDWTPYWRQSLAPVRVTELVSLVPAWEDSPPDVPCALRIDPGMAFGAGDHPTTRLCLRVLEGFAGAGQLPDRVLDVGAGTGVLALASARFGAGRADALDIDPFGYAACRRNAWLNDLQDRVRPLLRSLDLVEERFPLVLANIVAGQLKRLASLLREHLEEGGRLVISGFETEAVPGLRRALELSLEDRFEEEGWVALVLRKAPTAAPELNLPPPKREDPT